ncbi:MAG: PqqD family protein [Chloroflexales bacterium]|nr:PqqD family protein [Chloroflexales bacterium]
MSKVQVCSDLIAQDFGNEMVIINGMQDTVCILNETGATIFKALRTPLTTTELVERLVNMYQVPFETIEHDIGEYLQALIHQGVLQWID